MRTLAVAAEIPRRSEAIADRAGQAERMRKGYGPWVRHDWCPCCRTTTEQTRWHAGMFGEAVDDGRDRVRCNVCASVVTPVEDAELSAG